MTKDKEQLPEKKPKPTPTQKKGLPINPRDMTVGRRGAYKTR